MIDGDDVYDMCRECNELILSSPDRTHTGYTVCDSCLTNKEKIKQNTIDALKERTDDVVRLDSGCVLVNNKIVVTLVKHKWRQNNKWTWYRGHDDILKTYDKYDWGRYV